MSDDPSEIRDPPPEPDYFYGEEDDPATVDGGDYDGPWDDWD
jgi:hypothetical protein